MGTDKLYIWNIPDYRRELYFRIIDNENKTKEQLNTIAMPLFFLDDHFPPNKLDSALRWLCKNDIIGKKFLRWYREECKGSDLEMHRLLLSIVDNAALDRVIAGKNFK